MPDGRAPERQSKRAPRHADSAGGAACVCVGRRGVAAESLDRPPVPRRHASQDSDHIPLTLALPRPSRPCRLTALR
jgi:hypothetical protein